MTFPLLDNELLKAFVAVADHRSFTRAAATLHRTQSAVSMQIKRLEQRLGVDLFDRSRPRVELSSAGEGLLGHARRMLALSDQAVGQLQHHTVDGRVRLGIMEDYGTLIAPPLLASFVARHPHVHVEMETGLTSRMLERLGSDFDLVIAMHPQGDGDGDFLRREQAVWATGIAHTAERFDPLALALYPTGCLFRAWAVEALDAAHKPWRLSFVSHSLAAVEAIAAQGLAVTVVKSGTFPRRLRPLSERDGMPRLPAADIRLHRASNLSSAAGRLADHLMAQMVHTVTSQTGLQHRSS